MKKMTIFLFAILCLMITSQSQAQKSCRAQELHQQKLLKDSDYKKQYDQYEKKVKQLIESGQFDRKAVCAMPTFFPIAIHYDWDPGNAADRNQLIALAQNQVATLNTAFNSNDCQGGPNTNCFEFILATYGHPAASGIAEGDPAVTFGGTPGADYCGTDGGLTTPCNLTNWVGYMNITVNDLAGDNACQDLGVSELPGNPTTANSMSVNSCAFGSIGVVTGGTIDQVLDGSAIGSCDCLEGSVNGGTTVTHEIGHFLGLFHTFCNDSPDNGPAGTNPTGSIPDGTGCQQDNICEFGCTTVGGAGPAGEPVCDCDLVADTPPQAYSNNGCPGGTAAGTVNNPTEDAPAMMRPFNNFMDYVDDACMTCFSVGQYTRVMATLASPAAGLSNYKSKAETTMPSSSCPSVAVHNWTGATDDDWHNASNWDTGCVPTSTSTVVIPDVTTDPFIYGFETGMADNVTISAGGHLTIEADGTLTISSPNVVVEDTGMLTAESTAIVTVSN